LTRVELRRQQRSTVAMAAPPMPSMEEFLNRLRQHGVEINETGKIVFGPRGWIKFRYAVRPGHGVYPLPDLEDVELVTPTVVRSVCKALGIPPSVFGLDLPEDVDDGYDA